VIGGHGATGVHLKRRLRIGNATYFNLGPRARPLSHGRHTSVAGGGIIPSPVIDRPLGLKILREYSDSAANRTAA